jgi:tRNA pseudouridine(55) synthase
MSEVIVWYKKIGETPLEALERARIDRNIPADIPMTYAGRLDPLVEGLLIILVGEACKTKDEYNKLDKAYEFEILSGVSTDSYDLLGLVTETNFPKTLKTEEVTNYLETNKKTITQNYPPYSSKTFEGKQLHTHAREGSFPAVSHEVILYDYEFLSEREIKKEELIKTILERIYLVHGDFRQDEIKKKWIETLGSTSTNFQITKWRVKVSSGFYIRQLVQDIGTHLEIPTVTFYIKRTQIGDYS